MSERVSNRRQEVQLLPECIDDYVEATNPVRALDAYVDSLDLPTLGFLVKEAGTRGRKQTYEPEAMLKLLIYGYLNQVRSSRKLERETKRNLEVIWLMERARPDHWTINEFRRRHRKSFQKVLRDFHRICDFLELFGREIEAIDGSFFKALNNKSKNFTKAKLERLEAKIDAAIEKYLDDLDQEDSAGTEAPAVNEPNEPNEPKEPNEPNEPNEPVRNLVAKGSLEELQAKKRRVKELKQGCEESESGQVSLSDEDSRLLRKGGQSVVGHNVQSVVDGDHHLIAHVEIVQAGNDAGQLEPMARAGCEALGIEWDGEVPEGGPVKVVADGGYSNSAQVAACEEAGLEVHLPLKKTTAIETAGYREEDFRHDAESDEYECPQGKRLKRHADKKSKATVYRVYYNTAACRGCPCLERCTEGKFRKLAISEHREVEEKVRERMAGNPEVYGLRKQIVEHPFGTLKSVWGYRQFMVRGKEGCEGELNLMALCYNWTRVFNEVGFERLMEAIEAVLATVFGDWRSRSLGLSAVD